MRRASFVLDRIAKVVDRKRKPTERIIKMMDRTIAILINLD